MSASRKVVELFYDVLSPYSWLGFEVLCRYRNVWNIDLRLRPTLLSGIMQGSGSLSAMRLLTAVSEKDLGQETRVEKLSRELWMRIWNRDEDITQPASLSEAALKAGISRQEVEELLQIITSQPIKDKLKSTTQEAMNHGAFGLPMTVCHISGKPEMFFGSDRFELMAHCIGEKWVGPQPMASRL
ncbi:glutathione S-transferase kappa 1-like isoform X2 [Denticeps clupeoides]|uniref:glutathione S-transferase kappa 1-like isoform X2 n=1 Tax=Denticeps clupeoides TaxID=299321 RepID=UPI0010A4D8D6|nr:glutathione S-transferase kappa 1-like isoform X2 [Denticeps clupeoides]